MKWLAVALALVGSCFEPAYAADVTSPARASWTPATGATLGHDVFVFRSSTGWNLEGRVAGAEAQIVGAVGETIGVKVRGVSASEVGPESPTSELVLVVAPATKRRVWVQRLSRARCEELRAPGWVPYHDTVPGQPGQAEIGCEGAP